jgi:uncharacterized protein YneF (UPF0154 family)
MPTLNIYKSNYNTSMSNKNSDINQEDWGRIDIKRGELTLPFTQDQFSVFIASLFGKPERISRFIEGAFEIELGDIRNIHFCIEERVNQQNKGGVVQFNSKIFYDDNSSILLNNFESFSNYTESRYVSPRKIELSWQYLIRFEDRVAPEKQEINIHIIADGRSGNELSIFHEPGFFIGIEYTARTWATDMSSMLEKHVKDLIILPTKRDRISEFVSSNSVAIGVISGVVFFIFSLLGCFVSTNNFVANRIGNTTKFVSENPDLSTKIDFLINYIARSEVAHFYFYLAIFLVVMIIVSIFTGAFIAEKAELKSPRSYILMTNKVRKKRESDLRKEKDNFYVFLLSIFSVISLNVLSNYIFMYLTTK